MNANYSMPTPQQNNGTMPMPHSVSQGSPYPSDVPLQPAHVSPQMPQQGIMPMPTPHQQQQAPMPYEPGTGQIPFNPKAGTQSIPYPINPIPTAPSAPQPGSNYNPPMQNHTGPGMPYPPPQQDMPYPGAQQSMQHGPTAPQGASYPGMKVPGAGAEYKGMGKGMQPKQKQKGGVTHGFEKQKKDHHKQMQMNMEDHNQQMQQMQQSMFQDMQQMHGSMFQQMQQTMNSMSMMQPLGPTAPMAQPPFMQSPMMPMNMQGQDPLSMMFQQAPTDRIKSPGNMGAHGQQYPGQPQGPTMSMPQPPS